MSLPTDGPVDTFGCRPIDRLEDSLIDISVGARMLADNWHIHPAWFNGTGEGLEGHSAAIQEIDSDESDKSETESSVGSHEESLAISNDTWIETPWGEYAQHGPQAHAILNGAQVLDVVQNPIVYSSKSSNYVYMFNMICLCSHTYLMPSLLPKASPFLNMPYPSDPTNLHMAELTCT